MARRGQKQPLPPALPPETRTVGQLVAETIRFYGAHFWPSLALGIPFAVLALASTPLGREGRIAVLLPVGAIAFALAYVGAATVVRQAPADWSRIWTGFVAGILIYVPLPLLSLVFILPAFAWLAFVGLAVPVAVFEGTSLLRSFGRAIALARADYIHALGALATLAITTFLTTGVLFLALQGAGEATLAGASFLTQLVVSPVLFLGGALLYFDQAAREVGSRPRPNSKKRSGRAEVPPHDDSDRSGRSDAKGKSRQAARGQS